MSVERETGNVEFCHRCGAELPTREWAGEGGFFCPHCGAPQILLPEHMRADGAGSAEETGPASTGMEAPPVPREVEWRSALRYGGLVALVGGALTGIGLVSGLMSFLGFLWVVSGGVIVLSLYQKQRPTPRVNVRVGFRVGAAAGLLMAAALAVAFGTAGVVARFGLHRMGEFDAELTESAQRVQTWMNANMKQQDENGDMRQILVKMNRSPEFRAGEYVAGAAIQAAFLVLLSAGGGAFAGMLGTRRRGARGLL